MADNVGYTPGSGASIAADDVGGVLHQRVKVTLGADGVSSGDVSSSNPMPVTQGAGAIFDINAVGELIECLQAMRQYQVSLNRTIGMIMPDTSGRMRVLVDAITTGLTLSTITNVTSVSTLTQMGSQPAQEVIYSALHIGADNLRRNITVS